MDKGKAKRIYQAVGAQLRQWRNEKGLTQDDVAVNVGIDRRHYGRVESGQSRISLVRLLEVCSYLQVDPGPLVSRLVEGVAE